jgi:hypothetical protein
MPDDEGDHPGIAPKTAQRIKMPQDQDGEGGEWDASDEGQRQ